MIECVREYQQFPSVSRAPSTERRGLTARSVIDGDSSFGAHALLTKLHSFSHVSSKLMMRFPFSIWSSSFSAYCCRRMRHRCELPYDGTFFVLRKLKPNSFFMSRLTLSCRTVTYCDSSSSLTTVPTFGMTFLSRVNFSNTECIASCVSSSRSSFCLTYSIFSGCFNASFTTLLTSISDIRCLRAISRS